ncbi:DUF4435 domain-containing protein [Photobacterium carnosum]|uniref:DUF4435 domain-containing protein n=1 Tax=Photobacterium carnosum TaxID=2023717 RepID=UPI001E31A02A|nr:DUF4435 domain-containing protein [Photobacterium carnosum]
MSDFDYSDDALSVMNEFYSADKIVYVEGDDDVVFWEGIFTKLSSKVYYFKSVDGCENLEPYRFKIISGVIDDIVASDLDYSIFEEGIIAPTHKNLIWTYGHSIENTVLSKEIIPSIITTLARVSKKIVDPIQLNLWYASFIESFTPLIKYDLSSEVQKTGIAVLGDNCTRFMLGERSPDPCLKKINNYIEDNKLESIVLVDENMIEQTLECKGRLLSDFVRGHFLFSACLKYVNHFVKKIGKNKTLSVDAFFSGVMLSFNINFNENHQHYNYYRDQIIILEAA